MSWADDSLRNSLQIFLSCHLEHSNRAPASKLTVLRCVCVSYSRCLTRHLCTIYMPCLHKYALRCVYVCGCLCVCAHLICVCILYLFLQHHHTYSADSCWIKGLADRPLSALCLLLWIHQSHDRAVNLSPSLRFIEMIYTYCLLLAQILDCILK